MKKIVSLMLATVMLFSISIGSYANQNESMAQISSFKLKGQEQERYLVLEQIETIYGTMYYVKKTSKQNNGTVEIQTIWDLVDIVMAGASWADLFAQPSWGNFGWAVLDTAALLPVLPSSAYFRKGGQVFLKIDEVAKFAKTPAGKKAVTAAMRAYKFSEAISSKAVKAISKQFKGKEGEKVLQLFKDAADKGMVGGTNQSGIKSITPSSTIGKEYTHEIKITNAQYADYRIFGYKTKTGEWIFDLFRRGLH